MEASDPRWQAIVKEDRRIDRARVREAVAFLHSASHAEVVEFLRRFAEEAACSGAEEVLRFAQGPGTNAYLAPRAESQIRREARRAVPWVVADVLVDAAGDILLSSSSSPRSRDP